MFVTVSSAALSGFDAYIVGVEVDASPGLPMFELVGYVSSAVKEARERVRVAVRNAGYRIDPTRITVNLSPANIRKDGPGFDLPIAIGILQAQERIQREACEGILFLGELGLDGTLKPITGVLPIVMEAARRGFRTVILPFENLYEGQCVEGIRLFGASSLTEVIEYLMGKESLRQELERQKTEILRLLPRTSRKKEEEPDFGQVYGQEALKRCAVIAAAGFHHLLIYGAPGAGKSLSARCMTSILPPLTGKESLEVSKIQSICGCFDATEGLAKHRPFLSPHHTSTPFSFTGGGSIPKPGTLSRAHRGILFLDEFPLFSRETLELLREPLSDKNVNVARVNGVYSFPAAFLLVAAMNPCPCGFYPDRNRCRCTPGEIRKYLSRVSGPILDRIDMHIPVAAVEYAAIKKQGETTDSSTMQEQVIRARKMQERRFAGTEILFNGELSPTKIKEYCVLNAEAMACMEKLYAAMHLSLRSHDKILRVARTIADLEEREEILPEDLLEAAGYQSEELWEVPGNE